MNTNDHGRKEPSLADLEAFEKLLRESLHAEVPPVASTPAAVSAAPATAPVAAAPLSAADHDAMAELTRLIEAPLDFALPTMAEAPKAPAPVPAPPPEPVAAPVPELHGHFETTFSPDWPAEPHVEAHLPPPAPAVAAPVTPPPALDPLAAFEEELRRFDASRIGTPEPEPILAPPAYEPLVAQPALHDLAERQRVEAASYEQDYAAPPVVAAPPAYEPITLPPQPPAYAEPSPLEAAEQRLAAEAAAASYAENEAPVSDVKRSRGVFMALGGLAVAGLAVIGGGMMFSGSKKSSPNGDVPVIAAKQQPTKEKPADPGGVEIPNQNAQVLTGRNATQETQPAKQVVNNTEQPLDLKEVTRRDSVRVIAPSPYQQGAPTPTAESAQAGVRPADVEQRRVTSVRIPLNGEPAAAPSGGNAATAAVAGVAAVAGAAALANAASTPPRVAPTAAAPRVEPPKVDAPKSESRPTQPVAQPKKAETPKVATAAATPKAKTPEKVTPQKVTPPRSANAPMPLTGNDKAKASPAAASGGSGYAVQLASRPTEADARSAASSLGSKFSAQLGGRGARVVSGEANGQKVFRVRAGGFSQQAAIDACNKIKASGGACFITKQ